MKTKMIICCPPQILSTRLLKIKKQKKEMQDLSICINSIWLIHALQIAWQNSSVPIIGYKDNIFPWLQEKKNTNASK